MAIHSRPARHGLPGPRAHSATSANEAQPSTYTVENFGPDGHCGAAINEVTTCTTVNTARAVCTAVQCSPERHVTTAMAITARSPSRRSPVNVTSARSQSGAVQTVRTMTRDNPADFHPARARVLEKGDQAEDAVQEENHRGD